MEEIGYVMFTIGTIGLGILLAYGVYLSAGIFPALSVICIELIVAGIILGYK